MGIKTWEMDHNFSSGLYVIQYKLKMQNEIRPAGCKAGGVGGHWGERACQEQADWQILSPYLMTTMQRLGKGQSSQSHRRGELLGLLLTQANGCQQNVTKFCLRLYCLLIKKNKLACIEEHSGYSVTCTWSIPNCNRYSSKKE